jgi:hypothetical protein
MERKFIEEVCDIRKHWSPKTLSQLQAQVLFLCSRTNKPLSPENVLVLMVCLHHMRKFPDFDGHVMPVPIRLLKAVFTNLPQDTQDPQPRAGWFICYDRAKDLFSVSGFEGDGSDEASASITSAKRVRDSKTPQPVTTIFDHDTLTDDEDERGPPDGVTPAPFCRDDPRQETPKFSLVGKYMQSDNWWTVKKGKGYVDWTTKLSTLGCLSLAELPASDSE